MSLALLPHATSKPKWASHTGSVRICIVCTSFVGNGPCNRNLPAADAPQDAVWAGQMEVQAATEAFQCNIHIYQQGQPCWRVITHTLPENVPCLHLSYHDGDHYNSVRLADDTGSGKPEPIKLADCVVSADAEVLAEVSRLLPDLLACGRVVSGSHGVVSMGHAAFAASAVALTCALQLPTCMALLVLATLRISWHSTVHQLSCSLIQLQLHKRR